MTGAKHPAHVNEKHKVNDVVKEDKSSIFGKKRVKGHLHRDKQ